MDDFERIRNRLVAPTPRPPGPVPGSSFVGQVVSTGTNLGVGKFAMVLPLAVSGAEVEGTAGTMNASGVAPVPVYMVGPSAPAFGEQFVVHYVDYRWVAERRVAGGGSGSTGTHPNCVCATPPMSISLVSTNTTCNFSMFQSDTLTYNDSTTTTTAHGVTVTAKTYYGSTVHPDPARPFSSGFFYIMFCSINVWRLSRTWPEFDGPGSLPSQDGIIASWNIGVSGNTCNPFRLTNGVQFNGSNCPANSVKINP